MRVINPNQFSFNIASLRRQITDSAPTMRKIATHMKTTTDLRFRETKDEEENRWKPLKYTTIRGRIKKASSDGGISDGLAKPLNDTGRLKNSIHLKYGSKFAAVGTNTIYAKTHQFGARKGSFGTDSRGRPIPWGDIPARKYLGFSRTQKRKYAKMVAELFVIK